MWVNFIVSKFCLPIISDWPILLLLENNKYRLFPDCKFGSFEQDLEGTKAKNLGAGAHNSFQEHIKRRAQKWSNRYELKFRDLGQIWVWKLFLLGTPKGTKTFPKNVKADSEQLCNLWLFPSHMLLQPKFVKTIHKRHTSCLLKIDSGWILLEHLYMQRASTLNVYIKVEIYLGEVQHLAHGPHGMLGLRM
jgi:hypothetical protein